MSIPGFGSINGAAGAPIAASPVPTLQTIVSVMYNYYDPSLITDEGNNLTTNSANRIALNPFGYTISNYDVTIDESANSTITQSEFLNLFYATNSGYFNINPSNGNNPAVILSSQTITSSNSLLNNFSLVQSLLRAYCTNKGVTVNDIDPRIMVLLQKECYTCQSLASIKGTCISMSWDEVISAAITSGVIIAQTDESITPTPTATVPLAILLNYHSFVLNTDLAIRFVYNVVLEGYSTPTSGWGAAQPTYNCAINATPA